VHANVSRHNVSYQNTRTQPERTKRDPTEFFDRVVSDFRVEDLSVDVRDTDAVAENIAADHNIVFCDGRRRPTDNDRVCQRPYV